jgi:hypothetical protein
MPRPAAPRLGEHSWNGGKRLRPRASRIEESLAVEMIAHAITIGFDIPVDDNAQFDSPASSSAEGGANIRDSHVA